VLIGSERVAETIRAESNKAHYRRMSAAIDPVNRVVVWTAPTVDVPTKWYFYHWELDRFSTATQSASLLFSGFSTDLTLEQVGAAYPNLDTAPESLDSDFWRGGAPAIYVMDSSYALGTLTGSNAAASFELTPQELTVGRWSRVHRVRPGCDATTGLTLTMKERTRAGDSANTKTYTALRTSGDMPVRVNSRYVQPKLAIAAGTTWTYANGLEIEAEPGSAH
jgi:hypothetical protein